jgi:hypothetical protein
MYTRNGDVEKASAALAEFMSQLATGEFLPNAAKALKRFYEALKAEGFTPEEAMSILKANPLSAQVNKS